MISLEAEVERRAKAKRNEGFTPGPKIDFVYESAQMEDAVNSVLCGTSIKDAASAYGVSKNALKQVGLYLYWFTDFVLKLLLLFMFFCILACFLILGTEARTGQGAAGRRWSKGDGRRGGS